MKTSHETLDDLIYFNLLSVLLLYLYLTRPNQKQLVIFLALFKLMHLASGLDDTFDTNTLNGDNGFIIEGESAGDMLGTAIAGIGDFDGDGTGDLLTAASQVGYIGRGNCGASYPIWGKNETQTSPLDLSSLMPTGGRFIYGAEDGEFFGSSAAQTGDLNSDLLSDVCIGAENANTTNGASSGRVICLYAQSSAWTADLETSAIIRARGVEFLGGAPGDFFGSAICSLGLFNNDSRPDVAFGARHASPLGRTQAGYTYLAFSVDGGWVTPVDTSIPNSSTGIQYYGRNAFDFSGSTISGGVDANQDSNPELLIGAPGMSPGGQTQGGGADLVFGFDGPYDDVDLRNLNPGITGACFESYDAQANAGTSVLLYDVDGDNLADIFIGSPGMTVLGRTQAGKISLYFGRSSWASNCYNLSLPADVEWYGPSAFARLGENVCAGGDVNFDGYQDFLTTAPFASPPTGSQAGIGYAFYGRPRASWAATYDTANLAPNDATQVYGRQANTKLITCAGLGDVNRDGIDDIAFAAPQALVNRGETNVIYGRDDPKLNASTVTTTPSNSASSFSQSQTATTIQTINPTPTPSQIFESNVSVTSRSSETPLINSSSVTTRASAPSSQTSFSFFTPSSEPINTERDIVLYTFSIQTYTTVYLEIGGTTTLSANVFPFASAGITPNDSDTFTLLTEGISLSVAGEEGVDLFTYAQLLAGDVDLLVQVSACGEDFQQIDFEANGQSYTGIFSVSSEPQYQECEANSAGRLSLF